MWPFFRTSAFLYLLRTLVILKTSMAVYGCNSSAQEVKAGSRLDASLGYVAALTRDPLSRDKKENKKRRV